MTSKQRKERDGHLVRYLLKCYPFCTDENHEDNRDFIDDMSDLLLARSTIANEK